MTEGLSIRTESGALSITLDRPEQLNALTADMADRVAEEIEEAAARCKVSSSILPQLPAVGMYPISL